MIRDNISFAHRNVAHLSIVYELGISSIDLKLDFTPGNCLFAAMNLTKNVDPDKYGYGGEGIEFDACSQFSLSNGDGGKNVVIFGVHNSSSTYADNTKNRYLSSW